VATTHDLENRLWNNRAANQIKVAISPTWASTWLSLAVNPPTRRTSADDGELGRTSADPPPAVLTTAFLTSAGV